MLLTMTMMGNDDDRDSVIGDDGDLENILCVIILMMLMISFLDDTFGSHHKACSTQV